MELLKTFKLVKTTLEKGQALGEKFLNRHFTNSHITNNRNSLFVSFSGQSHLPCASLSGNGLVIDDDSFYKAIDNGFFQVKVPEDILDHMENMRKFSHEFYKDKKNDGSFEDRYRGYNLEFNKKHPFAYNAVEEGYMVDNHKGLKETNENQVERFSLKKAPPTINHWKEFYPSEIEKAAEEKNRIAILIMRMTLKKIGIPPELWSKATGRSIDNQGAHYLLFNHYRPNIPTRGLKAHKDWSNITLLCPDGKEPYAHGLEAYIGNQWEKIVTKGKEYLIVNFGLTLELFTKGLGNHREIKAAIHRVTQQNDDRDHRCSSVLFIDHAFECPIYRLCPDGKKLDVIHDDFSKFIEWATEETYNGPDSK